MLIFAYVAQKPPGRAMPCPYEISKSSNDYDLWTVGNSISIAHVDAVDVKTRWITVVDIQKQSH